MKDVYILTPPLRVPFTVYVETATRLRIHISAAAKNELNTSCESKRALPTVCKAAVAGIGGVIQSSLSNSALIKSSTLDLCSYNKGPE